MEKPSALEELIRVVPEHILQQPCSDEHFREIGICITNWQTIAPHLNLSPADEEDIATYSGDKHIKMLRRWQEKIGSGATYRSLADSFQKIDRVDLIDKIRAFLTEQLLPSPKRSRVQEQNSAAIPGLLQAFQSSHSTQPISSYPTFHDLTSQEETMTVQSPNRKRSLPAEEGACSSVSPPPHSREEEYSSKTGINFTGTSPYEEWCCHLIYDGGTHDAASGVIVKLNYPPEKLHTHLPGLRPMKEYPNVYGSVETSYILITCHRVIPGMSYLKGWSLDVGLEKSILKSPLKHLVCGAVSCCGENGFISGGPLKPEEETSVFSPHQNGRCLLDLDFTILFLNPEFEKHVLSRKGVQTEPPEINLNLKTERHQQLQLYQHERHRVVPIPLTSDRVQSRAQDSSLRTCTLSDEIEVHKTRQVIHYTQSESKLTQCCSGSPLFSCDPDSDETLVGIHVKADSDCSGSGITIYGIFQLLKGQLAAFFVAMEHADARKKWPFRWAHLLTPTLESDVVGQKEKPLSYLLDILNLLLTDMSGIRLIELHVSDTSLKHKSALKLLSALFKQFDEYKCEEIAKAVSEMVTDKITEKLQQLTKFLVNLLEYLLCIRCNIQSKADLVKAYFVCYKQVLNFEYKGKMQPAELSTPDVTAMLQSLRKECSERLPPDTDYVIGNNFQDIWLQLMECKYDFQIHQLEEQNEQLKEQLKEQKTMYESQIQELKAQLQNAMKTGRRKRS